MAHRGAVAVQCETAEYGPVRAILTVSDCHRSVLLIEMGILRTPTWVRPILSQGAPRLSVPAGRQLEATGVALDSRFRAFPHGRASAAAPRGRGKEGGCCEIRDRAGGVRSLMLGKRQEVCAF